MACVSKKSSSEDQYGFANVPECLEDVTSEWCEKALKLGNSKPVISQDTQVLSINVERLKNAITG